MPYFSTTFPALVLALSASAQSLSAPGAFFLNVCRDTPYGELQPRSDITSALQWALTNQHVGGGFKPYVPAGEWVYSETLRIPNRESGCLYGMGQGSNETSGAGTQTTLYYVGDPNEPSIVYQGINWDIVDICFCGRPHHYIKANKPRPSLGLLIDCIKDKNDPHYQQSFTSKLHLDDVSFYGWEVGVQNGGKLKTANCEQHVLDDVYFRDCGIGWRNVNEQGVEIVVNRVQVPGNSVDVAFQFDAGGFVTFRNALLSDRNADAIFLVLGKNVGHTSGGFYFENCKRDASLDGTSDAEWVHMLHPACIDIVMDRLHESHVTFAHNGGKTATLKGDVTLTLRDCYRPGKILCESIPYGRGATLRPHIFAENCRLADGKLFIEGPHSLAMDHCLNWTRSTKSTETLPYLVPPRSSFEEASTATSAE